MIRLLGHGLGAGMVAGLVAALAMLALRFALGTPSLQEVLAEKLLSFLSPQAFEFLLEQFWELGKPLAVAGLTVMLALAGGPVGLGYGWALDRLPAWVHWWRLLTGLLFGIVLWFLLSVALLPLVGGGLWGRDVPGGAFGFSLAAFIATGIYGVTLAWLMARGQGTATAASEAASKAMTRRAFLGRALLWTVVIGAVGFGIRALVSGAARVTGSRVSSRDAGTIPPEVTSTERFYVVSKNLVDPEVDGKSWRLRVEGMVQRPYALTLEELRALPAVEPFITLECISNPVGGDLISNGRWKGVPLREILEQAGLQPGVARVTFRSADGYMEGLPLADAMRAEVLVAYEMNGEPLPPKHGFPARLLIPGRYGMKGPKWLERIATTDDAGFRGYWEQRGWDDRAEVLTTSQVLAPPDGTVLAYSAMLVGGVAFSGDKGVSRVEFSADGGKTWHSGTVKAALSPYTWVLWTTEWRPPAPGRYRLAVRAYERDGKPQDPRQRDPAPSGATGYHIIDVVVKEA